MIHHVLGGLSRDGADSDDLGFFAGDGTRRVSAPKGLAQEGMGDPMPPPTRRDTGEGTHRSLQRRNALPGLLSDTLQPPRVWFLSESALGAFYSGEEQEVGGANTKRWVSRMSFIGSKLRGHRKGKEGRRRESTK